MLYKKSFCAFFLCSIFSFVQLSAQHIAWDDLHHYTSSHEPQLINEFMGWLSIPNIATDSVNIRNNAEALEVMMKQKGIQHVQLLYDDSRQTPPVVFGEYLVPGASKTVIFYAHYDGQPVNPALWAKGLDPFHPVLVKGTIEEQNEIVQPADLKFPLNADWRIYARGASDDKAGVMVIVNALDVILKSKLTPAFNIKFFFEGEEEQGSNHLRDILVKNRALLASDLWVICDGPVHQAGNKQVVFGARGDVHINLKVFGPKYPLHSGHYGNWVPNPVLTMSRLLASMKSENGRVLIPDFYKDTEPLTAVENAAIAAMPDIGPMMKKKIGFAKEEMAGTSLYNALNLPSLNINGIESSNRGAISANVIPASVSSVLDLRMVKGNDWRRQQQKVLEFIKKQGFHVVSKEPTNEERSLYEKIIQVNNDSGYNAFKSKMDLPSAQKILASMQQTTKLTVLSVPTLGGSLPLQVIADELHAVPLVIPVANFDNNQHAENENLRIGNFFEGIDTMIAIMLTKL